MKKMLFASSGFILFFFSAFLARAEIRWGCEVHGLFAFVYDAEVKSDWQTWDEENAYGGGASLVLDLSRNVKLDFGLDYLEAGLDPTPSWLSSAEMTLIPVSLAARIGIPVDLFFLYAGGGIGYSFNEVETGHSPDIKVYDSFTYFAFLGLEAVVGEMGSEKLFRETFRNVALRGEIRFNWMEPELKWYAEKEDWTYNYMQLRAGLVFYF